MAFDCISLLKNLFTLKSLFRIDFFLFMPS